MNKEELKYSYLEYSPDITEEIFDKIILKLKDLGFIEFSTNNEYINFIKDSDSKLVLSPSNEYYVSDGNMSDRTKLKVSDILGEEIKFEVGKWYSFYWNWSSGFDVIVKIVELGEYVRFDNFINITQGSYLDQGFNSISLAEIENIKELTLEEIQQYLPDGHVDKIKTIDKWWLNLKPGDKIKCAEVEQDSPAGDIYGGCGWKSNEIFTVRRVDGYESYGVIFIEEHNQQGIFTNSCTPYSEPKPLTVDDLVEGEIYYCENTYFTGGRHGYVFLKNGDNGIKHLVIGGLKFLKKGWSFWADKNTINLRVTTPEEKHWLLTCIKQDKFIPKEDLSKYDSEGNLIEVKEYVHCETQEQWDFVISKFNPADLSKQTFNIYENIGIDLMDGCYTDSNWYDKGGYKKITFQEWLDLNGYTFTDEEPKSIDKPFEFNKWYKPNNADGLFFIQSENTGYGFRSNYKNCWITNNKDYNWYFKNLIPASSEEVKERLLKYAKEKYPIGTQFKELNTPYSLKDFDEAEFDYYPKNDQLTCGQSIYIKGKWAEVISNPEIKTDKCMLETTEVNRNVYYEVETQEQYNEILDWLESKGEVLHDSTRKLEVHNNWKYVVFDLGISSSWSLYCGKKDLLKAEFKFKNKSKTQPIKTGIGLSEQILQYPYQYGYKTIDSSSVWEILMNPLTQNSRAELKQEPIKLVSFEEDDVVLFKTNSVKISNKQLIIND